MHNAPHERPSRADESRGTGSWLLDGEADGQWIAGDPEQHTPDARDGAASDRPRPRGAVEDVFRLDYDREIAYLVREGKLRPGLAPREIKR